MKMFQNKKENELLDIFTLFKRYRPNLEKIAEKFTTYLDNLGNSFSNDAENKRKEKVNPSKSYFLNQVKKLFK